MAIVVAGSGWYTRASFWVTNAPLTFMTWLYPSSTATYKAIGGQQSAQVLQIHTGKLSVGTTTNDFDGGTTLSTSTWYHGAWTREGGSHDLFLNGISDRATAADTQAVATGLIIGDWDAVGGNAYQGRLAAVKIWNARLTRAEILAEKAQYVPVRLRNLMAFYPMRTIAEDQIDLRFGKLLTVAGSGQADADGPPIPWLVPLKRFHQIATFAAEPAAVVGSTVGGPLAGGDHLAGGILVGGRLAH